MTGRRAAAFLTARNAFCGPDDTEAGAIGMSPTRSRFVTKGIVRAGVAQAIEMPDLRVESLVQFAKRGDDLGVDGR